MAEIPDELENELMRPFYSRPNISMEDRRAIRDALQAAYRECWERCEAYMRQTVGEWHESRPFGY